MEKIEIPVTNLYTLLDAAFPIMKEAGKSGLLVQAGPLFRLLHFDAIYRALNVGKTTLADVEEFEPVQRVDPMEASARGLNLADPFASEPQFNDFLDDVHSLFGVISATLGMATLVSRHEHLIDPFTPAPSIVQCENPRTPHFYPPNQRTQGQQTCSLCRYALA